MARTSRAKILKGTEKDFANKTEKTIEFLEKYVECGDPKEAWKSVGNSSTTEHWQRMPSKRVYVLRHCKTSYIELVMMLL